MKIATWNVNSIRTRLSHVVNWLQDHPVDVLCLQETKVVDEGFPRESFTELGYHSYTFGQKSYNGVAILTRQPLSDVCLGFAGVLGEGVLPIDEQKRVIAGVADGIRIVNLYVPNGSSVGSEKYVYKLQWLEVLHEYLKVLLASQPAQLLVCGDFNVALEDIDIYNPTGKEKEVMATPLERQALRASVLDLGLADVFRKFTPEGGHFSWWDYRQAAFRRNLGWRIDHIYLTPDLYERAIACTIDVEPRKLEQPSDHVPVTVEL
ncbi:MAG: exodeoxyribonuclease III [Leptolyngbyaceae cyanobacterium HOT.MB2.61]|jgi:Exodeoxyribonuclease III (EC 3.1.11.2)|nr:exodeoxyribonuclease III [Leptolyngbyaceae cyanobacterium HOT.MB2.61]